VVVVLTGRVLGRGLRVGAGGGVGSLSLPLSSLTARRTKKKKQKY